MKSHSELRFDAETHQYWLGKKRIPGVSEILQKVGLSKDYTGVDTFYRDRGIATHKAIELYLKGVLDTSSLDECIKPQFEAFIKFITANPLEDIKALEVPMAMQDGSFAGTPDLVTKNAIIDWKCSKSHDKVAEIQGQAYKLLIGKPIPFIVVELHDDGIFETFDYGTQTDLWDSVMNLYKWKTGK